jgi:hypothetical protein
MINTHARDTRPQPNAKIVQYVVSKANAAAQIASAAALAAKLHRKIGTDLPGLAWRVS